MKIFKTHKNKVMKLGVSYNIFDSEELLKASIINIRDSADYINIVYQKTSNHGQECSPYLLALCEELKQQGLVCECIEYIPDLNKSAHENEMMKRNIGLYYAKKAKCTHFMTMDADEFYYKEQLVYAKNFILKHKLDATACMCYNYATPNIRHRSIYLAGGVSFIYKIRRFSKFTNCFFPVLVDPTRRILSSHKNFYIFSPHELVMHHYTYVRNDIIKKWMNSSSLNPHTNDEIHKKAVELKIILSKPESQIFQELKFSYCGGLKDGDDTLMMVDDYFNIRSYLNEFKEKYINNPKP